MNILTIEDHKLAIIALERACNAKTTEILQALKSGQPTDDFAGVIPAFASQIENAKLVVKELEKAEKARMLAIKQAQKARKLATKREVARIQDASTDALFVEIKKENADLLEIALKTVQRQVGQNGISVDHLFGFVKELKKDPDKKPYRFTYLDAGASSRSYRYPINSTKIIILSFEEKYWLESVDRVLQWPKARGIEESVRVPPDKIERYRVQLANLNPIGQQIAS